MRREEASDFDYAEATMHLIVPEAARRARQLMPPPQELRLGFHVQLLSELFEFYLGY